jgi:hypothetical protein
MRLALARCALLGVLATVAVAAPTAAYAGDPPRFTVSSTQHCGWMPVSKTQLMYGDIVTVTMSDPNYRGPYWDWDGTEVIYYRYWLRAQPAVGPWMHADLSAPGWGGGGSVTLPSGVSEASTNFLIRPGAGAPWLEVLGDLAFLDTPLIAPAAGTVEPALLACS